MINPSDVTIKYHQSMTTYATRAEAIEAGNRDSIGAYAFVGLARIGHGYSYRFEPHGDFELPDRVTQQRVDVHRVEYAAIFAVQVPARNEPITDEELRNDR